MKVYDESGGLIEDYDLDAGYLEAKSKTVEHRWAVDAEEQGEWITTAEYPDTGGKDVEWRVTSPEKGHWETVDAETGEVVADFDGTVPDDLPHDVGTPDIWEYGVYVPYTEEELAAIEERKASGQRSAAKSRQTATALSMFVQSAALPRAEAVAVAFLYPEWDGGGVSYQAGQWVLYESDLYHVEQAHTSQPDWTPDAAPSLYTRMRLAPDGVRIWEQPTHAENAFDKGEKCHYPDADGSVYRSTMDGNTTEPTTVSAMWEEVE